MQRGRIRGSNWGCYCFLCEKKSVKHFVQCNVFDQSPPSQTTSQHIAPLPICVKMFHSQCYLVATVIHIQSLRRHIYMCVYTHYLRCGGAGRLKEIQTFGTAVNAACHGKLFACHFGDACYRFASPAINCSKYVYILAISVIFCQQVFRSEYLHVTIFAVETDVLQVYWGAT